MLDQLFKLERRYLELENLLSQAQIVNNANEFRKISKERASLEDSVKICRSLKECIKEIDNLKILYDESFGEMKDMAFDELQIYMKKYDTLLNEGRIQLLPKDITDSRNIFLEIRAGAGGDEASLFVSELFRAYMRFCERQKLKFEIVSFNENGLGGYKEVIAFIEGENVYRMLKYESGVHRVQRVPQTESQGRVHTSTITVAVMPEVDDVEVSINENDLKIDTYRASGAGGQHVNRTDSAVRITHIPSGIVVACQDERSQIKNRSKAMKVLQSKLFELAQMEQEKALSAERKAQVGRGDRSERIRTYNFPQSRITDHRINMTIHSITDFMDGDLIFVVKALQDFYQTQALAMQAKGEGL